MVEHPSELPMISEAERRQLLVEWNDSQRDYPKNKCIHELFEAQAEKTPGAVAVLFDGKQLTYRELNTRANQLAHYLRVLEVGPEILVGVCLERSLEMIIGILGILKAGGTYVPLDPAYPKERLAFMLEDAHLSVLLTQQSLVAKLPQYHGRLVCMDANRPMIDCSSGENPAREVTAENLAYVIYTSGSTGVPKGVAIEHHSAVTLLHWAMDVFSPEKTKGVLASTSICFDLSVFEMFLPLSHGGKVILVENALHLSTLDAAADVTLINTVPSAVAELLRSSELPRSVGTICLAGEPLSPRLVEQIYEQGTVRQVFDLYGPSEDTTYSTFALRHSTGPATIGRPIANTQVYILDHRMQPVSIGVAGELFIGGDGLARGYRNRPGATAEKFLPNPFSDEPGRRLYRTGDSARYLPDGNIEFLGRIDNQVKIRGFRIELGEIETVLEQHSGVGQAVVLARGDTSSDKQLVAYVVPSQALSPSTTELRDFVTSKLPFFMVPSAFVSLEALPLTPNGKIDRRALPAPDRVRPETVTFVPFRNPIEEVVAGIWSEVLKLERIGVHDNFFELGGHSLLATRVISRLRRAFRRDFPLRLLFEAPTIASLAALIETTGRNECDSQLVPPLRPISRQGHLPLSFAQQRLWVLDRLEPGNPTYNMPVAVRLTGTLDIPALDQSLNEIVRRHEALRTTFAMVDGEPIQVIASSLTITMSVVDLQELPPDKRELRARQMMTEEAKTPFDLAQGPLLRSALIRLGSQHHILLVTMHHIVSDGWSMGVFFHDLSVLYQAYSAGAKSSLPELPIQYKDFALWQRQWLQGEALTTQLAYWKQQLDAVPVLELPTDHPRSPAQTYRGARHSLVLSKALSDALTKLGHQENVTLFMTLLAAFQILLQRYTGQSDITVGSPIAGRHQIEVEGLIGFFLNSLVLRTELSDNPSFPDLLARVRQVALDAYTHQDLPFEKLLEELRPDRDLSRTPLFQVFFNMLEFGEDKALNLPGVTAELLEFDEPASNFDLTLYAGDRDGAVWFSLVYNPDLFESATISRLLDHYHTLLEAITANSQQRISSLPLLSEAERNQLRAQRNRIAPANSFIEFKKDDIEQSISARFEKLVNVHPNQVAVKTRNYRWTYAELNRAANQIAQTILRSCDGGEARIALLFEHDAPMIAAILGVLKSGNAYVPLDITHPKERLAYILEDSQATALLTTRNTVAVATMLSNGPLKIIDINEIDDALSTANLGLPILPGAQAYILYTSGSTGQPKGVVQNHRNVLHHIANYTNGLHLNPDDRLTLIPSYGFDAAVMDIFGALLNGATLYPMDLKEDDRTALLARMVEEKITIYHSTPTVYRYLVGSLTGKEDLSAIRFAVLGGEEVLKRDVDLFRRHFSVNAIFVNGLGPTESTLALQYFIDHETQVIGNIVPVGYAVEDTEILLLNEAGEQTEIYGEIGIRSDHLAPGYWQNPEITEAAFFPDPEGGTKQIYRTGDMGRLLSDGSIAFTGRKDFQVKIRGIRIEPGEIEAALGQHPEVRECVVLAREDILDGKRLVVYIVVNQQRAPSTHDLRSFLKQKLPDYMVPSAFVYLDALPRTPNGKVDRKALPSPDQSVIGLEESYVAPRSSVEEILVGIWVDVLKLERVGIHDNFFELGGHSLLATQVISRLRNAIQIELPLRALFEAPTIASLAKGVEASQRATQEITRLSMPAILREGDLPLSFAQARLWFLDQLEPNSSVYNLANGIRLRGTLHVAAFEQSLNEIVRRHEALRTRFSMVEGEPVQVISSSFILPLPLLDLSNLSETEREAEAQRLADEENQRPFDLAQGPLLRSKLVRLGDDDHVLLVTMHHIVSDGWSMGVFFRELSILYEAFANGMPSPLPDLPIQYADYAVWQRDWLKGTILDAQLSYWKKQLENVPTLQLPTDRRRPPVQSYRGAGQSLELSKALSDQVKALSRKEGATLFMTLLAAFQTLLCRYTGQEDIVMGSPIAGRTRAEMEGLIGFLVNTLVLRGDLSGNPTFRELLARVRVAAFEAYAHQDVPFEKLVEELQPQRNLSHSPLFQIMFVLQNAPSTPLEFEGLNMSPVRIESETAKFDLTLSIREEGDGLRGHLQYNTDLFDGYTVERMLGHFENLLKEIVADPDRRLSDFSLLTQAERHQLLVEWNDTKRDYPEEKCVHQLLEEQVERTPDAIAVVYEGQELSYRELNQRANQVAHHLMQRGVGPELLVGICMERSLEIVVAVLGTLKTGAAYVPLDSESPQERLAFMLSDTRAPVLLTQAKLVKKDRSQKTDGSDPLFSILDPQLKVVCLDKDWKDIAHESNANPRSEAAPGDLAYVTYTSGSTGQPKGVMIEHRSLVSYLHWVNSCLLDDDIGTVPMITEITFDACLKQLFAPLLCGKQIWLVPRDLVIQPVALLQEIRKKSRVGLNCVPSLWAAILNEIDSVQAMTLAKSLTSLFLGGERLSEELVSKSLTALPALEVWNLYGPTETTANASNVKIVSSDKVTIGNPVSNTEIYLLDNHLQPVPVGVIGEIYIGGVGLARGYLNRPDLTAELFIASPFGALPGARMYRTGDLARYLPDGRIDFIGRIDHQVKIRGFRIELGEIESTLNQHPAVRESVVLAREDSGDRRLAAYIVAAQQPAPSTDNLRSFLKQKLPDYMLPTAFVFLDSLPLTPNGKVDRRALPAPDQSRPEPEESYVAPRTQVEDRLAKIWTEVLRLERVGIHDNFFNLGGHSLKATQVMSRLCEVFQVEMPLRKLFEHPTVAGLAESLEANRRTSNQPRRLDVNTTTVRETGEI